MKSLSCQIIPRCLYMVPDTNQQLKSSTKTTTAATTKSNRSENRSTIIRLIRWDGKVEFYEQPIKASELMSQFPEYLVCHSESFHIGKKVPTLSEDDQLQMGQSYFLLPTHFFQSVLSFVSITASFANRNRNNDNYRDIMVGGGKAAILKIFDICRTQSGALQIRLSDDFIEKLINRGKKDGVRSNDDCFEVGLRLCTTVALEEEYKKLVRLKKSQQWKPKLDSVIERSEKYATTRTSSGLIGKIKERRKKKSKNCNLCHFSS